MKLLISASLLAGAVAFGGDDTVDRRSLDDPTDCVAAWSGTPCYSRYTSGCSECATLATRPYTAVADDWTSIYGDWTDQYTGDYVAIWTGYGDDWVAKYGEGYADQYLDYADSILDAYGEDYVADAMAAGLDYAAQYTGENYGIPYLKSGLAIAQYYSTPEYVESFANQYQKYYSGDVGSKQAGKYVKYASKVASKWANEDWSSYVPEYQNYVDAAIASEGAKKGIKLAKKWTPGKTGF